MSFEVWYKEQGYDPLINKPHTSAGFQIIQVCSDGGTILIDNRFYPMTQGSIYLINCIKPHYTNPKIVNEYVRNKLVFSEQYLLNILKPFGLEKMLDELFLKCHNPYRKLDMQSAQIVNDLFKNISKETNSNYFYSDALIKSYIIQILTIAYNNVFEFDNFFPKHILDIMQYINNHFRENITIDTLCEKLHISKYYACHSFKKTTNITIMQYLTKQRLSEAKNLLLNSSLSITEITIKCGFSSISFFSRNFKKHENCTPMQFRKIYIKL